jgi:hypothetical protein
MNITKKYELYIDINNVPALKCYENNGFKRTNKQVKNSYLLRLRIK